MTPPPTIAGRRPELVTRGVAKRRQAWIEAATAADHKAVARLYIGTALSFLAVAAVEFFLVRIQLIAPDNTMIVPEVFNRINSAATVTFLMLFALPLLLGLLGYIVPLQIGSRGIALARVNQLGFWFLAMGAFTIYASFFYTVTEGGLQAAPPLSNSVFSPSHGIDTWIVGVALATLGFVCWAINMVATLRTMRAPGMAWRRTPLFSWAARVISYLLLFIGPVMIAALTMLFIDRNADGVFFDSQRDGAPLLYQHLTWIFFSGVQAILLIGAAGIISEIIPVFSRKPIFSHRTVAGSMVAIAVLSFFAYMQNMYSAPIGKGFMFMAMAAAVGMLIPIGLLLYVWVSTMWQGANRLRAPMLFALLSIIAMVTGLAGQLSTAVIPVGWQLEHTVAAQQDTIVTLVGAAVLGGFAAIHYWMPKITGKYAGEGLAKAAMGLIFIGLTLFAWAMFFAGVKGQPVDVYRFYEGTGVDGFNLVASIGAFILVIGVLVELANLAYSYANGRPAPHDPWGGSTLEWFALSPPVGHNFDAVPDVRGPEPLRDIRAAIRDREAAYVPPSSAPVPPSPEPERTEEPEAPAETPSAEAPTAAEAAATETERAPDSPEIVPEPAGDPEPEAADAPPAVPEDVAGDDAPASSEQTQADDEGTSVA